MSPDLSAARPRAEWIARYAARLLQLSPGLQPLDAVRKALDASTQAAGKDPDEAARLHSQHGPRSTN